MTVHNFEITHCSYSAETDLEKLNAKLKEFKELKDKPAFELQLYPPEFVQCSDITHFPKHFE